VNEESAALAASEVCAMDLSLAGRVALVTGGGSGIGRATCVQFAREGAKVIVADINEDFGHETLKIAEGGPGEAHFIKTDVSSATDVRSAVNFSVERWGHINVLINNAAIMSFKAVVDLADDEWDRVIAVNLRGPFLFCKYALPCMKRGAIVNVSSIHARKTEPNVTPYAASKGGLEAFTRALSLECAPNEVRVNCVAPAGVNTPMLWSNPSIKKLKREAVIYSEPEQIAEIICYLASDESASINGETIITDKSSCDNEPIPFRL